MLLLRNKSNRYSICGFDMVQIYNLFIVFYPLGASSEIHFVGVALNYINDGHHYITTTSNQLNITSNFNCFIVSVMVCNIC